MNKDKELDCTEKRFKRQSKKIIEENSAHHPKQIPKEIKCAKEIIRGSTTQSVPKKKRKPGMIVENTIIKYKQLNK